MPTYSWTLEESGLGQVEESPGGERSGAQKPRSLKLTSEGDLDFSSGSLEWTEGALAIAQSLRTRLSLFQGEYDLDLDEGLPYFQALLVKNPNPEIVRQAFRERIVATPGVLEVGRLALSLDAPSRTASVSFTVSTDVGELSAALSAEGTG